ncbi:MAG: hypothetical protein DIZ77_07275 [endosymbiont of Seepiophila jonesi]|uniref:Uncharacterized protein n=1 Tax=endosymbiont of Lamellibrachia luymesi TaxID=2200907 RepID=A0A370DU32_9GAMM|nr:MAG: hypothetical protein DIZ79_14600 [endosymbiont of Lamellibrachia luymesi]RDH92865.1 MAG: hypothetical protein DIZ77_07275 [endosymbiont of Seepiophila jonesi]
MLGELKAKGPLSAGGLAKALKRNYSNVHTDVQLLLEHQLIEKVQKDGKDLIHVPWDEVQIRLAMGGGYRCSGTKNGNAADAITSVIPANIAMILSGWSTYRIFRALCFSCRTVRYAAPQKVSGSSAGRMGLRFAVNVVVSSDTPKDGVRTIDFQRYFIIASYMDGVNVWFSIAL